MPLPLLPVGLENHADQVLAAYRAAVGAIQPAVLAAEGRYLQALRQPAIIPENGAAGALDPAGTRPSDRATSLAAHGVALPASARIATSVHEYLGPDGPGWGILQEVWIGPPGKLQTWQRFVHVEGPESAMGYPWTDITPEEVK